MQKKKNNKIILVIITKFSNRDYQRLGCDIMQKRGYEVEVWDCSLWYCPEYALNYNPTDCFVFSGLKSFKTFEATKSAFSKVVQKDIVIDVFQIIPELDFGKINGAKVVRLFCGQAPTVSIKYYQFDQYRLYFSNLYGEIINNPQKTFVRIKKKMFLKKPFHYDSQILGGRDSNKHKKKCVKNDSTFTVKAHAFDYDRYLEEETKEASKRDIPNVPYAVFLDAISPDHPDFYFSNTSIKIFTKKPELIFPEINEFFKKFSYESGLDIVIAAHPRSNYNTRNNPYYGNVPIMGRTISLVKEAKVVIAHMSMSLNFAVLYNKPVILLDSDYFTQYLKNLIDLYETELGAHKINITHNQSITENDLVVDKAKYRIFKEKYIKEPGTPEKFVWDIFCDYLLNENISNQNEKKYKIRN